MPLKKLIIKLLSERKHVRTADIIAAYKGKVTRQYINKVLRQLVDEGRAIKIGETRYAFYVRPELKAEALSETGERIKKRFKNSNLKEHEIFSEISAKLNFVISSGNNLKSIFDYAMSEMLNNAIEHSKSDFIEIEVFKETNMLTFIVSDFGIGVFRNVMKQRGLKSELEAIQDLLKGKTTTQPHAHTGEGIFFTSKVADVFLLDSFGYRLRVDNMLPDVFIEPLEHNKKGTRVTFSIRLDTQKHLNGIFKEYETNNAELGFDKTKIEIKLYTIGTIYVSRSQARRILSGLEKFKLIILDYDKVTTIGQAFADEIYRVFQQKYPAIKIGSVNMNEAVKFMIDRVDKPKTLF